VNGQTVLLMAGALLLMLSTLRLVRLRLLSIRYGIGWLLVGAVGVVGAPILTLTATSLDVLGFTPTGFSLGVFIAFLGLVCLQLSISLSGLHQAVQDLAEHAAHVEARLRTLEGGPPAPSSSRGSSDAPSRSGEVSV
jgi:hypothetical protein